MPETKRERVLTDDELAMVWAAADQTGYPFGSAVQMLILTGARREEIFGLSWSEVDGDLIRLPAERSKVKEGRTIPLSPPAFALLHSLPRFDDGDVVFSFTGKKRFDNVGRAKPRIDKAIADAHGEPLAAWRLHDLHRTVATGLQRLGARLEVIETVLGHVSGSRAGIVGTYQRHRFESEATAALVSWGEHITAKVKSSTEASVLPFPKGL